MKRLCQFFLLAGLTGALLATALPEAEAARKASLSENRLILDKNDVYMFPQVGAEHSQLVTLDLGPTEGEGSGLALLGDETLSYGLGISHGDVVGHRDFFLHDTGHPNLGGPGTPLNADFPGTNTVVDLMASADIGVGLVGGRLSLGNGGDSFTDEEDRTTGSSQTFVGLTLGYSLVDEIRVDAGLNIQYSMGSTTGLDGEGDVIDEVGGNWILGGLNARGYMPMVENVDLGVLADLHFSMANVTDFDEDPDDDVREQTTQLGVLGGAGPVYYIDDTTIAGYGVLGYMRQDTDPNADGTGDDETFDSSFSSMAVVPGVHLAADFAIFEWLYFRTGMQYNFGVAGFGDEVDMDENDDAVRDDEVGNDRLSNFGWRAGIGVEVGDFTLDGAFQSGFITNGPDFLGGEGGGMFTQVSAGYRF